jgi:hypothetical protein
MANVEFKLDLAGLNQLMKSGEMQAILNNAANRIAGSAGDGYEVESAHPISFVAIAAVHARTQEARHDNSENNTLLKAAGGVSL